MLSLSLSLSQVPKSDLRYIIGCYLPTENSTKTKLEDELQKADYKMWVFPKCSNAVMTEFPYRSMLSIIIAPSIVYPALKKYYKVRFFLCLWRMYVITQESRVDISCPGPLMLEGLCFCGCGQYNTSVTLGLPEAILFCDLSTEVVV